MTIIYAIAAVMFIALVCMYIVFSWAWRLPTPPPEPPEPLDGPPPWPFGTDDPALIDQWEDDYRMWAARQAARRATSKEK